MNQRQGRGYIMLMSNPFCKVFCALLCSLFSIFDMHFFLFSIFLVFHSFCLSFGEFFFLGFDMVFLYVFGSDISPLGEWLFY